MDTHISTSSNPGSSLPAEAHTGMLQDGHPHSHWGLCRREGAGSTRATRTQVQKPGKRALLPTTLGAPGAESFCPPCCPVSPTSTFCVQCACACVHAGHRKCSCSFQVTDINPRGGSECGQTHTHTTHRRHSQKALGVLDLKHFEITKCCHSMSHTGSMWSSNLLLRWPEKILSV